MRIPLRPLISWEKWQDPFKLVEDSDFDDEETAPEFDKLSGRKMKVMMTPLGIIPLTENMASSKAFNFWMGHTNFNLTKPLCKTIEGVDGVETLDIFTRYRMRISIGKAFAEQRVMQNIDQAIATYIHNRTYDETDKKFTQ